MTISQIESHVSEAVGAPDLNNPPAPLWVRLASRVIPWLPFGRYRAMNWLCRRPPASFLMHMSAQVGGARFICDLRDSISREVCFAGKYEIVETALIQMLLAPGMTFVDVGANWGYFSLLAAARVGPAGRVLALEADPRMASAMRTNISCNPFKNILLKEIAVAEISGFKMLAGYDETGGNFGVSRLIENETGSASQLKVRCQNLDSVLDECQIHNVDVVKIDVEGAEDLVLSGMRVGLQQKRYRIIVLELHPSLLQKKGKRAGDVTSELTETGYSGWVVDHSPSAVRKAAYERKIELCQYTRPYVPGAPLDAWPHTIWTCPGTKLNVATTANS